MKNRLTYNTFAHAQIVPLVDRLEYHARQMETSRHPRHLHRVRVTIRRLRNALNLFSDIFPPLPRKRWDYHIKVASNAASRARDIDVQIASLKSYITALSHGHERKDIRRLIDDFKRHRDTMQPAVMGALRGLRQGATLAAIKTACRTSVISREDPFERIYIVGFNEIRDRVGKVLTFESCLNQPEKADPLHKMRIANKHLRYALEVLRPVYSRELSVFLEKILFFHRTLGELHDQDVWIAYLAGMDVRRSTAAQNLKSHCCSRRRQCYNAFKISWRRQRRDRLFEDLLGYFCSALP